MKRTKGISQGAGLRAANPSSSHQEAEGGAGSGVSPGTEANEALVGAPGGEGRGSGPATLRAGARPGQGARPGRLHPPQTPPNTPGLGRRREVARGRGQTVLAPQCPQGGGSSQRRPEPGTALPGSGLGRSGGPPSQRVASLCSRKGGAPAPGSRLVLQPAPRAGGDVCPRLPLPPVAPGAPWGPGPPSCAKSRAHGDLLEGLVAGQAQGSGPEPGGPATCSAMGSTQGRRVTAPSVAVQTADTRKSDDYRPCVVGSGGGCKETGRSCGWRGGF